MPLTYKYKRDVIQDFKSNNDRASDSVSSTAQVAVGKVS
jgi:hypothetical protein